MINSDEIDRFGSALHLIHRVEQCATELFKKSNIPGGLTPRQFRVLHQVAQHEGISQSGIVERTGIDRSTLGEILRRLVAKELLRRKRAKNDERANEVRLTKYGHDLLSQAIPIAQSVETDLLSVLPPKKRTEFIATMATIVASLQDIDTPKSPRL